ncbi:hypothetical protein PoB_001104500 [Plakobranchus ocellatus]|uniref:PX domain-containing protein n=1 Tax=Plakobranchus ocellatus TaxID=259542 RepID=A0AAV3YP84_9GAST|nr:hypothetical protein PoB_001104500 [Plakobranchus ocellatus]
MAHFGKELDDFKGSRCIRIHSAEQTEQFTLYVITVSVGSYSWTVKHRYSEFHELHEKLTASYKLDKTLLPPKKIFGNQSESFIKKRQRELEIYLQTIILYLAQHIPSCLAYFLDFDKYEIHGITQAMAEDLYNRGEALLFSKEPFEVTSLQLFSLTERLKLPEPTCESGDVKKDLGHILDFITRCKQLKVICQREPVGTSNILMNKVPFDLTLFKSLQTLSIQGCNMRLITGLETVKQTLSKLEVHQSSSSMKEVLLQDAHHWRAEDGGIIVGYWDFVTAVDFSHNSFSEIHESIQLLPNLESLDMSHNVVESIQNLQWLSQLTFVDLSHNNIRHLDSLHTKLGNIKTLRISHNRLERLHGFAKLFSLQTLDISYNSISTIEELWFVSQLPCIEDLTVEGNAVTNSLDYRTKTLEMFGDRVREVVLDKQRSDQKELDTVAVLQALRKAKNVKIVKKSFQQKNPSALSLSDMYAEGADTPERRSSLTASPLPGNMSRSVPSNNGADWRKREQGASSSPVSQVSIKSFNSVQEQGEGLNSNSPGMAVSPLIRSGSTPQTSQLAQEALSDLEAEEELGHEFEQVPEAHPFDLNFDNMAVAAPKGSHAKAGEASGKAKSPAPKLLNKLKKSPQCSGLASSPGSKKQTEKQQQGREAPSQMRKLMSTSNVSDLPGMSDPKFISWLGEQLLGERGLSTEAASDTAESDSIIDILWCYGEQLSRPGNLFPCCAVLTRDKVVLERLVIPMDSSSLTNFPELKPITIVPICNLQQLVVGPCHAFLRLEEAFVGKPGTFTVFGVEPHGLKRFVNKLFQVCEDIDECNTPDCIDLSVQSDLLKEIVAWEEKHLSMASDRLAVAILMKESAAKDFTFLVLSENQVYCLDMSFVHWPPASFETSPDASITFKIQHAFSITNKIGNIKIHPLPDPGTTNLLFPQGSQHDVLVKENEEIQFLQYQLDLQVTLCSEGMSPVSRSVSPTQPQSVCGGNKADPSQQQHCSDVSYFFSSAAHRDLFLDRLTNLRAEQAHRMSPNVREEPEGGNELLPQSNKCGQIINSTQSGPALPKETDTVDDEEKSSEEKHHRIGPDVEEDALSSGSAQTATSEDNTVYYSASPSENLSVSPMSNFSRASISPPHTDQSTASGRKTIIPQVVTVEMNSAASNQFQQSDPSMPSELNFDKGNQDNQRAAVKSSYSAAVGGPQLESNSSENQQEFSLAYEHLKQRGTTSDIQAEESELDQHLRLCVRSYDLLAPLPVKLKPLHLMGGRDLRKFFKTSVLESSGLSIDGRGDSGLRSGMEEELRHLLWTCVVPYTDPKHEIVTLVMISTNGIYLVSDTSPSPSHKSRPSWMTHTRNQSDSVFAWKSSAMATAPANTTPMFSPPRVVADSADVRTDGGAASMIGYTSSVVKPYFRFHYKDLRQVDIGVFDQCVRLTGSCANSVFTLAVRDNAATEKLVQYLKDMLTLFYSAASSPSAASETSHLDMHLLSSWEAEDVYHEESHRTKSTLEGIVYTHPSQVKFVYPGEDAIRDILYLVNQRAGHHGRPQKASAAALGASPSVSVRDSPNSSLWLYILCHQLLREPQIDKMPASQARSVIITPTHFSLSQEDFVTYPLPDFVRGLPEHPCHQIVECRQIEALKCIKLYRCNPHWLALTFVDEAEGFVVDTSIEHFSPAQVGKEKQGRSPEVTLYFFIQSPKEKEKMVQLLGKLWKQLVTQVGRILDVTYV